VGTVKLEFHKEYTKFVDKENTYKEPPTITTAQTVADIEKPTNIDIPQIDDNVMESTDIPDINI
jgi:replicative DNA helicase